MKKHFIFPVDSFNNLTKTATSWTLIAIVLHMTVIGMIESSKIHFIISIVFGVIYFFRLFLMRLVVIIINNSLRSEKLRKENLKGSFNCHDTLEFQQILTDEQGWAVREILKQRRD